MLYKLIKMAYENSQFLVVLKGEILKKSPLRYISKYQTNSSIKCIRILTFVPMKSLFRLNKYFFKYKWLVILGTIFIICSNLLAIFPAQIFRHSIDTVIESLNLLKILGNGGLYDHFYGVLMKSFLFFGGSILLLALVKGVFTFLMRQTVIVMSRKIEFDLKNDIYDQYQRLSSSFYKRNKVGDIMNRISEDVSSVRMYLGPAVMYTINLVVLFVVVIYTMFSINTKLSWLTLAPLPLMSILIYYISNLINKRSSIVQFKLSNIFTRAQESFSGIRVVKAYNQINDQEDKFEDDCNEYLKSSMDLVRVNSLFHPVIILLPALSTLITLYVGGLQVIDGEISYGNIAEFVIYINMLTWPVASLGWVTSLVQKAAASQERINEFLNTPQGITNPTISDFNLEGDLEFRNVSFTYKDSGITALKNISFKLKKGETLAILGKTGSGKSTLANILLRMIDPDEGEVLLNSHDLRDVNLYQHRRRIGYVPQEVFLFSESIKDNIAFGKVQGKADMENVKEAAKLAAVNSNIEEFPDQYETIVGERGVTLSGGQKQRVSIARALMKKPGFLLFDDCLSAVDTETEEEILSNLKGLMKEKSSIIISHRVSSVKTADQIIILDDGVIVEQGNNNELLKLNGIYKRLHDHQLSK